MIFYITKYALTTGIKEVHGGIDEDGKYVHVKNSHHSWNDYFRLGKEAFQFRPDAVAAAEEMRLKKIKSLQEQLKKLEKKMFV